MLTCSSDGKERSAGIHGHIYINSHVAGICLNMYIMFGLPSIIAAVDCTPTYTPRALLEALMLDFILSLEKLCEVKLYLHFVGE